MYFKTFFARAHQEWRESHATTAGVQFGSNNMEDTTTATANAISELSAATAADKATMVSLTATVQTLTTQLAAVHSQLASTQAQLIAALANKSGGGNYARGTRDKNRIHTDQTATTATRAGLTATTPAPTIPTNLPVTKTT